ncbi:hypothetical protein B4140_0338 [Bacillus amyloliquefaciens]|nr:hypothetical protein B4140_0338 [Bacillus amyloliquefaciens]
MHPSKRPQRGLQPYSESAIKIRDRLPDTACLAFASGLPRGVRLQVMYNFRIKKGG